MEENQLKAGLTFEDIYNRFGDRFKQLANEIIGDVITEYLPHAETDLDLNVYHRAMEYIAGNFGESTLYGSMGKKFRQHIFDENKEMIVGQLSQDLLEENIDLKHQIKNYRETIMRMRQ